MRAGLEPPAAAPVRLRHQYRGVFPQAPHRARQDVIDQPGWNPSQLGIRISRALAKGGTGQQGHCHFLGSEIIKSARHGASLGQRSGRWRRIPSRKTARNQPRCAGNRGGQYRPPDCSGHCRPAVQSLQAPSQQQPLQPQRHGAGPASGKPAVTLFCCCGGALPRCRPGPSASARRLPAPARLPVEHGNRNHRCRRSRSDRSDRSPPPAATA